MESLYDETNDFLTYVNQDLLEDYSSKTDSTSPNPPSNTFDPFNAAGSPQWSSTSSDSPRDPSSQLDDPSQFWLSSRPFLQPQCNPFDVSTNPMLMGLPEENNFNSFLTSCLPTYEFNTNIPTTNMVSLDPFINASLNNSTQAESSSLPTTTLPMDPAISALVSNPSLLFSFSNSYHQNLPATVDPLPLQPSTKPITPSKPTTLHAINPVSAPKDSPTTNRAPDKFAPKSKRGRKSTKTANTNPNPPTQPAPHYSSPPAPVTSVPITPAPQSRLVAPIALKPSNPSIVPIAPRVEPIPEPVLSESEKLRQQVINKKQERLIKNRAAALLSRKRKREHLAELETQNEALVCENQELKDKIKALEAQLVTAAQNNSSSSTNNEDQSLVVVKVEKNNESTEEAALQGNSGGKAKPIGATFFILLFSFCFFTLSPSILSHNTGLMSPALTPLPPAPQGYTYTKSHSSTPLLDPSPQLLFLDSSNSLSILNNNNSQDQGTTRDLSLTGRSYSSSLTSQALTTISAFHRRVDNQEFTSWILNHPRSYVCPKGNNEIAPVTQETSEDVAYLFSDRLTRFVPRNVKNHTNKEQDCSKSNKLPQLSIISPWALSQDGKEAQYLRLDVEVKSTQLVNTDNIIRL